MQLLKVCLLIELSQSAWKYDDAGLGFSDIGTFPAAMLALSSQSWHICVLNLLQYHEGVIPVTDLEDRHQRDRKHSNRNRS